MIKMKDKIYCSCCGVENSINQNYCKDCGEILHNFKEYETNNEINTIEELFTATHYHQLTDKILRIESYKAIIQNIIETGENEIIYKKKMTPLNRIKAIADAYAKVIYKNRGNTYGEYAYNVICIDKQFDSAIQIATILHELTHHLFNEIIEEILIFLWNVRKTPMLESFIQTMITIPSILLISEYCASSIEKEYLPPEYVSYSSFNSICADLNYDKNIILRAVIIGKSMTESIHQILSTFIDKELEEKIIKEFQINNTKTIAEPICITDIEKSNYILQNVYLMDMIINSYEIMNDKQIYPKIIKNKEYYEKFYEKESA